VGDEVTHADRQIGVHALFGDIGKRMIQVRSLGRRTTMARFALSVFGVFVMVVALGVPAQGADSAPLPPQDSVVGAGLTRNFLFLQISINAESDALGGNPSGRVSFFAGVAPGQYLPVGGPVTCLHVVQNQAHIGFVDEMSGFGPVMLFVSDNGPFEIDGFGGGLGLTDCLDRPPIPTFELFGGVEVFDAPSQDQCKDGGWRNYTDGNRTPFTGQSDCITFALGVR
jgi:hypothetical protein